MEETLKVVSFSEKNDALNAMVKNGYSPLQSGLGVPAGTYKFMTDAKQDIYGIRPVTAKASGIKFGLTLIAGTLEGADAKTQGILKQFGLSSSEAQMVVTADQWNTIKPDSAYTMVINEKGRVDSVTSLSEILVSEDQVITKPKKQKTKA